jgi:arginine-tRNA-protein transferase
MTRCPYLDKKRWTYSAFHADSVEGEVYERLLSRGWRRSGAYFYQNLCFGCGECRPLRVDVEKFKPSRSQQRNLKKNSDISCSVRSVSFNPGDLDLYVKYCNARHNGSDIPDEETFRSFFVETPLDSRLIKYYQGGRLLGIAWTDFMPESLSSVYFSYDPDSMKRGLGIFSILKQIELCRFLGKKWLHLGFYVKDSRKMNYKALFKPCQILKNGKWIDYSI